MPKKNHKWSLSTLYNWYVTCLGFCCCLARLCLFHWSLWHSLDDHHRWHHLGPPLLINISPVMTPMRRQSSCLWHLPHITIIIIMNKHKPSNCISHVSPVIIIIIIIIIIIELSSSSSSSLPLTHRKQLPRCVSHVSHVTAALLITPACHFTSISSHSASLPSSSSSSQSSTPMIITTAITTTSKTIRLQWSLWSSLPHFFAQVETITSLSQGYSLHYSSSQSIHCNSAIANFQSCLHHVFVSSPTDTTSTGQEDSTKW